MKKILLLMGILFSMTVSAQRVAKVGTVELGIPYAEALSAIKAEFGEPVSVSSDEVIYGKKNFRGFNYDEVKRFFMKVGSKGGAQKRMEDIARELGKTEGLSRDIEDNNTWFYKGGISPVGVSHLFTIYTYPKQGAYGTELRYGPVRFPEN